MIYDARYFLCISAGVGRTGTLVALDSLMQQLEDEGQVSIFNTVYDLRHQRNFLVQSLVWETVFSTMSSFRNILIIWFISFFF